VGQTTRSDAIARLDSQAQHGADAPRVEQAREIARQLAVAVELRMSATSRRRRVR
jgi:hypothetical protein